MGWQFRIRKVGLNYLYNVYQEKFNKQMSNTEGETFHCLKIQPFLNDISPYCIQRQLLRNKSEISLN